MKKRQTAIIAVILTLMMAFSVTGFTGCGEAGSGEQGDKTVTDCAGRQVKIPEDPENVACLYATAAHMMAMLDEGGKIVGCPNGVKSDVLMQMKYPEITETATPHQEGSVNAEELLRIDTDLALVSFSLAASEGEMAKLDELGIPYAVIDYTTIEELKEAVKVAGEIFGKEDKAQSYLEFFDETLAMVDRRLADVDIKDAPSVYHSVNEAIRTDPEGSVCSEIMERAKVEDVSVAKGTLSAGKNAYVTLEEIYNWDPDAFIANEYSVTDYILSDSKWSGLTAVKNGKVYTLPVGATRWCHPGSMEAHMGVLAVALQFYPDKFKDFNMNQYTADYYREYFGLELDDKTTDKILAGEGMRMSNSPIQ
ncbi:MAG: ABC transporter substrate-binding protein [Firmicutes bacterium]|nr:ABC transporter substrate-binding protein [Bacillota bacterium]